MGAVQSEERVTPVDIDIPDFGLFALHSKHGSRFFMPFETQRFHKFAVVSRGAGALDVSAAEVPLRDGDVVIVPAGTRHRFRDDPDQPMTLNIVCVAPVALRSARWVGQPWSQIVERAGVCRPCAIADAYQLAAMVRQIRSLVFTQTQKRSHWSLSMMAAWLELMALTLVVLDNRGKKYGGAQYSAFAGTISWLENHFQEKVQIAQLAERSGMSYRSYTARFRSVTGKTVNAFVTELRIRYAAGRIQQGTPILDAAMESGFSDLSHFYRTFRKYYGVTPAAFKNAGE